MNELQVVGELGNPTERATYSGADVLLYGKNLNVTLREDSVVGVTGYLVQLGSENILRPGDTVDAAQALGQPDEIREPLQSNIDVLYYRRHGLELVFSDGRFSWAWLDRKLYCQETHGPTSSQRREIGKFSL